MIPKRKTPKSGSTIPSKQSQKPISDRSSNTVSKPSQKNQSANNSNNNMPSIVELLQNQIDEERKNARNKNQAKSRQNNSSSQSRQVLHKKKSTQNNTTTPAPPTNSQQHSTQIAHSSQFNQEDNNRKPQYVSIETSSTPGTDKVETNKTEKVQMAVEAVGNDEAPQPKKLEPTGFTYFDKLNEKDIFLDPLKYF